MRNNYGMDTEYPTVNLAVKKSRLKLYNSGSAAPTYFLNKGQEFQIELFNPTRFTLLARITLNGTQISGGGLVLRPGERVYLDRFLDENKKFLFDTYKVDNIESVKRAIAENGDMVVRFHKEVEKVTRDLGINIATLDSLDFMDQDYSRNVGQYGTNSTQNINFVNNDTSSGNNSDLNFTTTTTGDLNLTYNQIDMPQDIYIPSRDESKPKTSRKRMKSSANLKNSSELKGRSKTIETGRVEKGSESKQALQQVDKEWSPYVFHVVEYKMLPLSQKTYESKEIVTRYCPNCGQKQKKAHNFCPKCGTEQ